MKVIFSTYETKEIGGSYLRSFSLAQGLADLGHEVTLWTSAKTITLLPTISEEKGMKIIESIGLFPYRFRKGGYDPFDVIFRTTIILFSKCKIIHSFNHRPAASLPGLFKSLFYPQTKWFLDWADLWGKGGVADQRHGPLSFITANVDLYTEYLFIKLAGSITAISDNLIKKSLKIRGNKKKTNYLPIGANIGDIKPLSKKESRKKLKLPLKKKIIVYLFVGTYDLKLLAQVFIEINKIRDDVNLLLLGPDAPEFYDQFDKHPSLLKKVIHPGLISRKLLSYYLAAGDIMLLPFTNREINLGRSPNKLGDYLAAGRPIAANPTGEVKKMLTKDEVGILVSENPTKFASSVEKLLNQPKKMDLLGKNARLLAESLSWGSVAKQLERFYLE
jgi:glycosyltransferase involved in cell wall biosynthesis